MTYIYLLLFTSFLINHFSNAVPNTKIDDKALIDDRNEIDDIEWEFENATPVDTRRILFGKKVEKGKRTYMVYLQLTKESAKAHKYRGWLCGGVIVHESYVLTSAACVEDADHFYIVSGTSKFVDSFDYKKDKCVCNNRRKVVWKCIPKNYKFDFEDSIKWSSNDIAIVKVDKPFKIDSRENECEFATSIITYNNISKELEKAGTKGYIAGWGTLGNFREGVYKRSSEGTPENSKCLQDAKVCIMDNEQCTKKWSQKFREIITQYMICTKDIQKRLSEICDKRYANCTDVEDMRRKQLSDMCDKRYANCTDVEDARRRDESISNLKIYEADIDFGRHLRSPNDYTARRSSTQGGFCENDHGGPLIVRYQRKEHVVGVISACKIDPKTHSCHGPFLYTSVFANRQFISCSINKDVESKCRRVFRSGITHEEYHVDWKGVEDDKDELSKKDLDSGDNNDDDSRDDTSEVLRGSGHKKKSLKSDDVKQEDVTKKNKKSKVRKGKGGKNDKPSKAGKDENTKRKDKLSYESSAEENVNDPEE